MQTADFETATLADAVQKAARVAPTKGSTLDRAAGILVELNVHDDAQCVVKATDLTVTFRQGVTCFGTASSEPYTWRLPSTLLSGFLTGLPMESGSRVQIKDADDGWVYLKCGATRAKFSTITAGTFPMIEPLDGGLLKSVEGFARRLRQVAWCVNKKHELWSGVHIDGEWLTATDGYTLAQVPCIVPVDRPVTAPLTTLSSLLKDTVEIALRASDRRLEIMTDQDTQATSLLIEKEYPAQIGLALERAYGHNGIIVSREAFTTAVRRMLVLAADSRETPLTSFNIKPGMVRISMEVPGVGMIVEEIDAEGGADFRFFATPALMLGAFESSNRGYVQLRYGDDPKAAVLVVDDDDYKALVMPRVTSSRPDEP